MALMEREESILADGTVVYRIGDEYVEADGNNISVGVRPGAADDGTYPDCPDCGGIVVWNEAGHVPGSRACKECGSQFADLRYHAQTPGQNMPIKEAGA